MDVATDSDAIVVNSRLEEKGYRRALLALGVFRLRLVFPLVAFFAFGALAAGRTEQTVLLFAILFGMGLIVYLWAMWHAHSPANRAIYAPVEYRFSPDRVEYETGGATGEIAWTSFKRWRFMSNHYLLHVTSATFLAIPTECVAPDDIGPLEALFSEKIRKGPRRARR